MKKIDLRWNSLSGATHVVSIWIQVFLAPCSMFTAAWRLADIEHIGNLHLWVSGKGLRAWYWRPLCIMGWCGWVRIWFKSLLLDWLHTVLRELHTVPVWRVAPSLWSGQCSLLTKWVLDHIVLHQDLFNSDTWSRLTIRTDLTLNKKNLLICAKHCEKSVKIYCLENLFETGAVIISILWMWKPGW